MNAFFEIAAVFVKQLGQWSHGRIYAADLTILIPEYFGETFMPQVFHTSSIKFPLCWHDFVNVTNALA